MSDRMNRLESPKLSTLERNFATWLAGVFPSALILPEYPVKPVDFTKNTCVITLKAVSDNIEGKAVTPLILHPLYTLSIFCQKYANCREYQETLIDALINLSPWVLNSEGLGVEWAYLENRVAPFLDSATELYRSAINYRFHLTTLQ